MLNEMIFIFKQMARGLLNIALYAAIAVLPAFYVADRVMTEMKKDQKNRSKSAGTDKDQNRYAA